MHLVHFSAEPLTTIKSTPFNPDVKGFRRWKPQGLWVSVEEPTNPDWLGWSNWCRSENFRLERLAHATRIFLKQDSRVLIIPQDMDINTFSNTFRKTDIPFRDEIYSIDWERVQQTYQAIIISPYDWTARHDLMWYYPWDCASGCIWDATAIKPV